MKNSVIKSISDFADVITGGTPSTTKPEYWDGEIAWLNSGALNDGDVRKPSKYITELGLKNSSAKLMPKDTVLIALTGATTGQVGYLTFEASANQSVTGILPSKEHYPRYLYYYLKTQRKKIQGDAFGGAQPHINQKYVKDFKIPLPPLDYQKRIAHLLGKVEGLIAQRKQHLQQLDDLLKSVFLDMFGDPVRNEKGWNTVPFHKVGQFISGGTPSKSREDFWGGSFPWVSPKDMKVSIIEDAADHISEVVFRETSLKRVPPKHLLIVVRGMILAHSFPVAINTVEIAINQDMKAIKPIKGINVIYLQSCLISLRRQILKLISTAGHGTRKFDSVAMQKLFVPNPPEKLQNQFAAIVEKVGGIKVRYQQSLTDLKNLYGALSQKAFKGELDLSRVPLQPINANLDVQEETDTVVANGTITDQQQPIDLPDIENMLSMLASNDGRQRILNHWLAAYAGQRKGAEFSVNDFLAAAQTRLAELHPDNDFEIGVAEYELLKDWVFDALKSGRLEQIYDDPGNRVQVVAAKG